MAVLKDNIFGVSEIGVYLVLNNRYFIHPPKINPNLKTFVKNMDSNIICIESFIGGAAVLGSLVAINSFGMVLPNSTTDDEIKLLKQKMRQDFQIGKVDIDQNAFGNLILCNDKGAIISSQIADAKEAINDILKIPVKVLDFAGSNLPGSCGIANNKGVVVHPMIKEEDAQVIYDHLQVDIDVTTVNCGNPFIGGGCVANDVGIIFGRNTTGPEIQRIMEILQID
jgi:translation initiation factor 6